MEKAKEGSLYRVVELGGRSFELRYGYYADVPRTCIIITDAAVVTEA